MAVKQYIALEGQTIYDLAILLYKDSRGVGELTKLNPNVFLDLDSTDFQGQIITYEDDKLFSSYVSPDNVVLNGLESYITGEGQSVYDVAIQLYGNLTDGLKNVLSHYLNLDAVPSVNIEIPRNRPDDPTGDLFRNKGILVATIGATVGEGDGIFDDSFDDSFE